MIFLSCFDMLFPTPNINYNSLRKLKSESFSSSSYYLASLITNYLVFSKSSLSNYPDCPFYLLSLLRLKFLLISYFCKLYSEYFQNLILKLYYAFVLDYRNSISSKKTTVTQGKLDVFFGFNTGPLMSMLCLTSGGPKAD